MIKKILRVLFALVVFLFIVVGASANSLDEKNEITFGMKLEEVERIVKERGQVINNITWDLNPISLICESKNESFGPLECWWKYYVFDREDERLFELAYFFRGGMSDFNSLKEYLVHEYGNPTSVFGENELGVSSYFYETIDQTQVIDAAHWIFEEDGRLVGIDICAESGRYLYVMIYDAASLFSYGDYESVLKGKISEIKNVDLNKDNILEYFSINVECLGFAEDTVRFRYGIFPKNAVYALNDMSSVDVVIPMQFIVYDDEVNESQAASRSYTTILKKDELYYHSGEFSVKAPKTKMENVYWDYSIQDISGNIGVPQKEKKKVANEINNYEYRILENGTAEITKYNGLGTKIEIPTSIDGYVVTSLGERAFYEKTSLVEAIIPEGIVSIGEYAFRSTDLRKITLPESLTSIGMGAFSDTDLKEITLPESILSIGEDVFSFCEELESIELPSHIEEISNGLFIDCIKLKKIDIPDSVRAIGSDAFKVSGIEGIIIPDSVKTIGVNAFAECKDLNYVKLPDDLEVLPENIFYNCSSLISITLPEKITEIGDAAFCGCDKLKSIRMGGDIKRIGKQAFSYCQSIKEFSIPEGVTTIGDRAFTYCYALQKIEIPGSVNEIGKRVFSSCKDLREVVVERDSASIDYCEENNLPYVIK